VGDFLTQFMAVAIEEDGGMHQSGIIAGGVPVSSRRTVRNHQVAGSTPAGGSKNFKLSRRFLPNRGGFAAHYFLGIRPLALISKRGGSYAMRDRRALIDQLGALLTDQRYSSVVVHNYCRGAEHFL